MGTMKLGTVQDAAKALATHNRGLMAGAVVVAVHADGRSAEAGAYFNGNPSRETLITAANALRAALDKTEADLAALNAEGN